MSRLRRLVIEKYADHYSRVNIPTHSTTLPTKILRGMQANYGDLIRSLPPGSQVLDLGCGVGFLLFWLSQQPGIIPIGVDSSITQVKVARENVPGVEIISEDGLEYLRKNTGRFKGIFCIDLLEHIPGDDLCLEWVEAARDALQPGGFFYCRCPNAANLTGNYSRYMDLTHERIFAGGFRATRLSGYPPSRCFSKRSYPLGG
jgi:cyclopropane fatty-acyl-phospholipid synthase-like methyltransferase